MRRQRTVTIPQESEEEGMLLSKKDVEVPPDAEFLQNSGNAAALSTELLVKRATETVEELEKQVDDLLQRSKQDIPAPEAAESAIESQSDKLSQMLASIYDQSQAIVFVFQEINDRISSRDSVLSTNQWSRFQTEIMRLQSRVDRAMTNTKNVYSKPFATSFILLTEDATSNVVDAEWVRDISWLSTKGPPHNFTCVG